MKKTNVGIAGIALVASTFALAGCGAIDGLLSGGNSATRDDQTQEVTEGGDADVFSLAVGDCFNDTSSSQLTSVPVVPCDEAHDNEVYFAFEMPDGDWPGDEAIQAAADEQCTAEFESFVGLSYDESELYWYPITPLEDGWNSIDDREVLCAIYDDSAQTTGTLKDAAR